MKRFFYTTAAVVAFAFSGMANTIEVNEKVFSNFKFEFEDELDSILNTTGVDCYQYAMNATLIETKHLGRPMTRSEFNEAFTFYHSACEDAKKSGSTIILLEPVIVSN